MKKLTIVLINILTIISVYSQKNQEFIGFLKLDDTMVITYKVKLNVLDSNISGYSITDFGGEHETKSEIVGTYSKDTKMLDIKEVGIVYTKSPVSEMDFCFVDVAPFKYIPSKTTHFKSAFKGYFSDGTSCIDGEIYLNSVEKVEKRMAKAEKKINRMKKIPDSIKKKADFKKMMDTLNLNVLKPNKVMSVFSKTNKIEVVLYDAGQLDGDRIKLEVNGKVVLRDFEVKKEKKIVTIELKSKKTEIKLTANNTGSISTNTASMEINNGQHNIKALSNLNKGESTKIDVFLLN